MRERYSHLAPLTIQERQDITLCALRYFSASSQAEVLTKLGKPKLEGKVYPLSSSDFLEFLKIEKVLEAPDKYTQNIRLLLDLLARIGFLVDIGGHGGGNVMLPRSYYFLKEFTTIQGKGLYSLAEPLGQDFLYSLVAPNIVHITGTTESGDVHAGTGIIMSDNAILTCAHVLKDMAVDNTQIFQDKNLTVLKSLTHDEIDVGLLYVDGAYLQYNTMALPFSDPIIGKELVVLGYPKIPMASHAPLTMQRGEVTCASFFTTTNDELFLFSAIARPGNSGGPILSKDGHFLGMVTRDLTYEASNFSPHFAGVPTSQIAKAVKELDSSLELPLEDYQ